MGEVFAYGGTRAVLCWKNMEEGAWGISRTMCGIYRQRAVGGGWVSIGARLPGVRGHTELSICSGLLLRFLDFVGLFPILLEPVVSFADDPLGLLLRSSGQHCCLGIGAGKQGSW